MLSWSSHLTKLATHQIRVLYMGQMQDCSKYIEREHQHHLQSVLGCKAWNGVMCHITVSHRHATALVNVLRADIFGRKRFALHVAHDKPGSVLDHCDWVITTMTRETPSSTDRPLRVLLLQAKVAKAVTILPSLFVVAVLLFPCVLLPRELDTQLTHP